MRDRVPACADLSEPRSRWIGEQGKLPQRRVFPHQETVPVAIDYRVKIHTDRLPAFAWRGHVGLSTGTLGDAASLQRALFATGRPERADRGAEFHHRLIHRSRISVSGDLFGSFPELGIPGFGPAIQSGQNAADVAVHYRKRFIERNAHDCAGHVSPDAGKLNERIVIVGDSAPVLGRYLPRGLPKVSGPAVITQSRPERENLFLGRARQRIQRRESFKKTGVVRKYRLDLGLLQHDLGKPHMIRGVGFAPGKRALGSVEPVG